LTVCTTLIPFSDLYCVTADTLYGHYHVGLKCTTENMCTYIRLVRT